MTDTDIIKDANRYRWLRDRSENVIIDLVSLRTWENVENYKAQLDNLIDNELASASAECLQMAEVITNQREWVGQPEERLFTEAQALDIAQKLFDSAALNAVPIGWVRKKEWQGLTDEEVKILATQGRTDFSRPAYNEFYSAIEAKLKEKNA